MGNYGSRTVLGESGEFDRTGYAVTGIGDINGDGIEDFAVTAQRGQGTPDGSYGSNNENGTVFVVYGTDDAELEFSLDDIDGTNGFQITPDLTDYNYYTVFGSSIVGLGDVNDDGIDDFAIVQNGSDVYYGGYYNGVPSDGVAYVIYGGQDVNGAEVAVDDLDHFRMDADGTISDVEALGDVNGDGINDIGIVTRQRNYDESRYIGITRLYDYDGNGVYDEGTQDFTNNFGRYVAIDDVTGYVVYGTEAGVDRTNNDPIADTGGSDVILNLNDIGVNSEGFEVDLGQEIGSYGGYYGEFAVAGAAIDIGIGNGFNGYSYGEAGFTAVDLDGDGINDVVSVSGGVYAEDVYAVYDRSGAGNDTYDGGIFSYSNGVTVDQGSTDGSGSAVSLNGVFPNERNDFSNLGNFSGNDAAQELGLATNGISGTFNSQLDPFTPGVFVLNGTGDFFDSGVFTLSDTQVLAGDGAFFYSANQDTDDGGAVSQILGVLGVGDLNPPADGSSDPSIDDMLVLARTRDDASSTGLTAYLVLGTEAPRSGLVELEQLVADGGAYRINFSNDDLGPFDAFTLGTGGDVNGDGAQDIILGEPNDDRATVIHGGDALAAADAADGSADGIIAASSFAVNVDTGLLPIELRISNSTNQADLILLEGDSGITDFEFTVTRTGDLTAEVSFDFVVAPGGVSTFRADADANDFDGGVFPSGTVTFADGENTATVVVPVSGDLIDEDAFEDFQVVISNPTTDSEALVRLIDDTADALIQNDDDPAQLRVNSTSVTEGDPGDDQVMRFTVTRSGDTSSTVSVDWLAQPYIFSSFQSAQSDDFEDGLNQTGSLTFAPGETSKTIELAILEDENPGEGTERITLTLSNETSDGVKGVEILSNNATGSIFEDDFAPRFDVSNVFVTETDDTNVTMTFTIVRSNDTSGTATIDFLLENNTTATDDFASGFLDPVTGQPRSGTLTFAPGVTTQTVTLEVAPDDEVEANEQVFLRLSNPTNDSGSGVPTFDALAIGTIQNDDIEVVFTTSNAFVTEGDPGDDRTMTFTIFRTGLLEGEASVDFAVQAFSGGNSADASDFVSGFPQNGTLVFADGETSKTVTLVVRGDNDIEEIEFVELVLSNAVPPTGEEARIADPSGIGQITNDDQPVIFSASNSSVVETDEGETSTMVFTVFRTGDTSVAASIDYNIPQYTLSQAADDDDIVGSFPLSGTLNFAAGVTSQSFNVEVSGDGDVETDEFFQVFFENADAGSTPTAISTSSVFGTIVNDDVATNHFVNNNVFVTEGASGTLTPVTFTIVRSGDTDVASSVDYSLLPNASNPGTSAESFDFQNGLPQSGTVNFTAGQTLAQLTFQVVDDEVLEGTEFARLELSNASAPDNGAGATISGSQAFVTITDDERPVVYSASSASTTEGDPGETSALTFNISRSGDTSVSGSVDYEITTYFFSGATDADITVPLPIIGTANFAAGQTNATVTVNVVGDNIVEGTEYLQIDLSNPQADDTSIDPMIGTSRAYGYIYDDDQPSFLRVIGSSVFEGDVGSASQLIFTIQRYGETDSRIEVDYDIGGGTVDADDFASDWPTSGSVIFEVGESSKQIILNVQGDEDIENDEFTYMTLSNANSLTSGVEAQITSGTAGATIRNDDFPAQITVNSFASTFEGDNAADNTFLTFTLSRSGDTTSVVEVDYDFTGSGFDPIDSDDLEGGMPQSGTVRFNAGQTTATVSFAVAEDEEVESNEQGLLRLSNERVISGEPDASVQLLRSTATGYINNDDQPPSIRVEVNGSTWGASVVEGNGGANPVTFTLIREGDSSGTLDIIYNIFSDTSNFRGASDLDFVGNPITEGLGNNIRFQNGETEKSVTVLVQGDRIIEANESFGLSIEAYTSSADIDYTVQNPVTFVTILNDDGRPPIPELPFDVNGDGVIEPGETIRVEADVFGDPHIVTLDGLGYDFQAVGEYILVETVEGVDNPFSVQVRFEAFPGSDLVSVTTRMAVEVKGKTIEIDAFADNPLTVDGVPVDLDEVALFGFDLDDDTENAQDIFIDEEGKIFITLNEAGEALMVGVLDGSLNVCVFLGDPAQGGNAGQVRGLMGNANQDLTDDFGLRDGSDIPEDVISFDDEGVPALTFDYVYGFGDFEGGGYRASWEVGDGERLFSDDAPDFPENFPAGPVDFSGVPASLLAAAEQAADDAGITDPTLRQAAILDFILTGDESFVEGTAGVAADPETSTDTTENPDSAPAVGVAANATEVTEGDNGSQAVVFTFYRTGDTTGALAVEYEIVGDVDADDLADGTPFVGTVSFDDGEAEQTLEVVVKGDLLTESDEALSVRITGTDNEAILVSGSQGTTQIRTDDFGPDAVDDLVTGQNNEAISGNVFADNGQGEDTDPDGDDLSVLRVIIGGATFDVDDSPIELPDGGGTLDIDALGNFEFTPGDAFADLADGALQNFVFDYVVSDGNGGTDTGTVTVSVEGTEDVIVNLPPVVFDDVFEVGEDDGLAVLGNLLANDVDAEGEVELAAVFDSSGAEIVIGVETALPEGGLLTVQEDGTVIYDPDGDFESRGFNPQPEPPATILQLSYQISDGEFTDSGTFEIGIRGENDAPVFISDTTFSIAENTTEIATLMATDVEEDDLEFSIGAGGDGALFEIDAETGALSFVDAPDFEMPGDADEDNLYALTVEVSDGIETTSQSITVAVTDVDEVVEPNVVQGGNGGFEVLTGTDGQDEIRSGGGAFDRMTGGAEADVFVFEGGSGDGRQTVEITDYEVGIDAIDLGGQGVLFDFAAGGTTYLYLDGGDFDTLIVKGANGLSDLTFVEDEMLF